MINNKAKSRLIRFLVLIAAFGFYSMAHAQRVNHNVELRVNDPQTELDIETRGNCSNDNHPGCIEVAHRTQGRFNFSLVGTKSCNLQPGSSWDLGEVYLGGKNSPSKPGSWGGFQNDTDVQSDFSLADAATGQLVKEAGSNQNSIVIFDNNTTAQGYEIWYKVTAVCVDADGRVLDTIETDPRIKNGGTQ